MLLSLNSLSLNSSALASIAAGGSDIYATSGARITDAMSLLVERAAEAGDIRADADPNDLLRALVGFTFGNASPGWRESALRLIDLLMDGLKREDDATKRSPAR